MRFYMLIDIEGVTGVTNYAQAEGSSFGVDMLMNDVSAVLDGLLQNPENEVTIYDEHMDGCNLRMEQIPAQVNCVRGKPLESCVWQGISNAYDGLIMVGFHSMAGTEGALLPHSFSLRNLDIRVNGVSTGEIGIETMIAGERCVPLVFFSGDSAGAVEARALSPEAEIVEVKQALGEREALCLSPKKTSIMLREAASRIAFSPPDAKPVRTEGPIRLEIDLAEGVFQDRVKQRFPDLFVGKSSTILFSESCLAKAWQAFLKVERSILDEMAAE